MSTNHVLLSLLATLLAGCATPYGGRLDIDHRPEQITGSITVSDAKLYRREGLINERRREVAYIDALMAASEKEGFHIGPEANREIEVIRALALSGGLNVDPAAGQDYRDSAETGRIRQEIDALRLQLELDQLRRDAALFRERLASQTDPSNADLGQAGAGSGAAAPPPLSAIDAADIAERMEKLQAALAGRLGAKFDPLAGVGIKGNPLDQFRDRAAYRQVLTTARNAASLDELHDLDGAALYRLNFQVSTLPPGDGHLRTAGLLEMRPVRTTPDADEIADIYSRWLDHINKTLIESKATDAAWLEVQGLAFDGRLFDTVALAYDDGRQPPKGAVPCVPGLRAWSHAEECHRGRMLVAVPRLQPGGAALPGNDYAIGTVLSQDIDGFLLDDNRYTQATGSAFGETGKANLPIDRERCEVRRDRSAAPMSDQHGLIHAAIAVQSATPHLNQVLRRIASARIGPAQRHALEAARRRLALANDRAGNVLSRLADAGCGNGRRVSWTKQAFVVPAEFAVLVGKPRGVRVYEIGPRQQVQQVSTAARAADAFSLAMALAAKAPTKGAAAKAGLGYSRSAIGKVDTLERLPVVVGFAQAGGVWTEPDSTDEADGQLQFGWILGPRISMHPKKGRLELAQGHSVYDLSADLAVRGWRTKLTLDVRTAWSPDWRSEGLGSNLWAYKDSPKRRITVDLRPSSAEFAALTTRLTVGTAGQRFASVRSIHPAVVKACAASTLVIEGENLWRATEIVVGGTKIGGSAIAVLPDMGGIAVDIPPNTNFFGNTLDLQVLTPYGVAEAPQGLTIDGIEPKGCGKPADPNAPVVAAIEPLPVNICSSPTLDVIGSNLDKITAVKLGAAEGTLAKGSAEKRSVSFVRKDLQQIGSEYPAMTFLADGKPVASKAIHVVRLDCGP